MIEYLSLEGGGVKAYAYAGVMKYFSEQGIDMSNLKVISGSSIGAFTALCIVLGYNYTDFETRLADLSLPNFLTFYTILKSIPSLLTHYGVMNTSPITKLITKAFETKNIDPEITFKELYDLLLPIDLIMTGSNVNTMKTNYFNYKNTPNMKIKDACMISMSYPILFTPTLLDNNFYCDGGLFRNLPFSYADLEYQQHLNSIGLVLQEASGVYQESRNFIDYMLCLINGIYNNCTWSDFKNDKYALDPRICIINIPGTISSFYVTPEQKEILIESGYQAIKDYLNKEGASILRTPSLI